MSQTAAAILQSVVLRSVLAPGWIALWWHWFQLRRDRWILYATGALTVLAGGSVLRARAIAHAVLPPSVEPVASLVNAGVKVGEVLLLGVVLAEVPA